ncbi:DUF1254 domain-containing protein [Roseococcus pinisoli]|uniref:DUF1254 domain-containing protein n=1 Tax=Roseococcus pinisoli TaxID=2835040 RepID=A0ABS5QEE9_9PROT|nr:DUF1254 domain-containing protein [Roseococcus pinisoli]MBS7811858.1 DUF1254 domain-containing protein [Roseococcus pinisoli]
MHGNSFIARRSALLAGGMLAALDVLPRPAAAQPGPPAFERGYPTAETSRLLRDEADMQRAVTAYRFWYPTVSVEGIFNGSREAGIEDNKAMGIAATGPRQVGFTLNSDTPYGSATLDLTGGPMVIEVPPGGYIGLVNDHHQGWVLDLGLPGPNEGRGGKHLILPPGYTGPVPEGHQVGRCASFKALLAVRALPVNADTRAALESLRRIRIYPLASAASPRLLDFVDTSDRRMDSTCLRWEDNFQFWEVLHRITEAEAPAERFLPMYGLLATLGIEKGKQFAPDARMRGILERAARAGRDQLLVSAFDSDRPDRVNWPDRRWEWAGLVADSAQFETPGGIDLEARDRWFAQAIVTSPAMFRRTAGAGSLYWLSARDASGAFLDGGKPYRLTLPQPVPGRLFWSVTLYDSATRSQVQTDQDKAALRSMFELRDAPTDAPLGLYFGPSAPTGQEGRWIKTAPGRGWFAYIRIYGPTEGAFDKSWKPGDFELVR